MNTGVEGCTLYFDAFLFLVFVHVCKGSLKKKLWLAENLVIFLIAGEMKSHNDIDIFSLACRYLSKLIYILHLKKTTTTKKQTKTKQKKSPLRFYDYLSIYSVDNIFCPQAERRKWSGWTPISKQYHLAVRHYHNTVLFRIQMLRRAVHQTQLFRLLIFFLFQFNENVILWIKSLI